jgi:hypothetical protein
MKEARISEDGRETSSVRLDWCGQSKRGSNQSGQMRPKARFEPAHQVNSLMLGWFPSSKEVYEFIGLGIIGSF